MGNKKESCIIEAIENGKFLGLRGNNWILAEKISKENLPSYKKDHYEVEGQNGKICKKLLDRKFIFKSGSFLVDGNIYDRYMLVQ